MNFKHFIVVQHFCVAQHSNVYIILPTCHFLQEISLQALDSTQVSSVQEARQLSAKSRKSVHSRSSEEVVMGMRRNHRNQKYNKNE